jgi:hypothetical protein
MMDDYSETDSDYTSYWRDWVSTISSSAFFTSCIFVVRRLDVARLARWTADSSVAKKHECCEGRLRAQDAISLHRRLSSPLLLFSSATYALKTTFDLRPTVRVASSKGFSGRRQGHNQCSSSICTTEDAL